ncbi:MAG: hypothetical protein J7L76_06090 [Spirochaetaceae bacterium]|nr:hypothetical protein [Spirochaetaceae bacterium]RKX79214.1 MAG: hypothetical protein DRP60_04730 [Spirochaetota bacterium]RKX97412.1 MAG: hypothetical protein DRZ90_06335 [Spirochaetota bacterium]
MEHVWEQLISLMEQERLLLDSFIEASGGMREALHDKNWPALEVSLKKMDGMADLMEVIEKKRHSIAELLLSGGISLETQIAGLPVEIRKTFQTARTELKVRLLLVKSRIRGVSGYAKSRGRLGKELMEELVPSTRGRMYNKQGHSASMGRDPLVVSHHL